MSAQETEPSEPSGRFEHVWEPPAGPDAETTATLLLLHGTGGSEHDLLPLGRQIGPGCGLLSPRGKVLEGGVSRRFFRRHGEGNLDIPDLIARSAELADFVGQSATSYGFDPGKVVAVGFSNGANVAVELLFGHPGLLRAAALLRPMLPYEPTGNLDLAGTDVLVCAGGRDPLIPVEQPERLATVLAGAGAEVTGVLDETAGHGLSRSDLEELTDWVGELS